MAVAALSFQPEIGTLSFLQLWVSNILSIVAGSAFLLSVLASKLVPGKAVVESFGVKPN